MVTNNNDKQTKEGVCRISDFLDKTRKCGLEFVARNEQKRNYTALPRAFVVSLFYINLFLYVVALILLETRLNLSV